ncbi:MAG: hypothetical protein ACFBWO_05225 [Paracoccaceae bacterium]
MPERLSDETSERLGELFVLAAALYFRMRLAYPAEERETAELAPVLDALFSTCLSLMALCEESHGAARARKGVGELLEALEDASEATMRAGETEASRSLKGIATRLGRAGRP